MTSLYKSLTFNQNGAEILLLDESKYPAPDERAVLNELPWFQYILDTQTTIEGVVDTLKAVRIQPVAGAPYRFVCGTLN